MADLTSLTWTFTWTRAILAMSLSGMTRKFTFDAIAGKL
jgi:hypothetical protein